jgi:hypothetical protein
MMTTRNGCPSDEDTIRFIAERGGFGGGVSLIGSA